MCDQRVHRPNAKTEFDPLISPFIKTILDHVKYSWNVAAYLSMTNCPDILRQILDELQLLQIEYFILSWPLCLVMYNTITFVFSKKQIADISTPNSFLKVQAFQPKLVLWCIALEALKGDVY